MGSTMSLANAASFAVALYDRQVEVSAKNAGHVDNTAQAFVALSSDAARATRYDLQLSCAQDGRLS